MDKKKLLRLLAENGRITAEEIAAQLGENAAAVAEAIRKMEEEKTITEKPKKLWDGALKMVKGENTTQLIDELSRFTNSKIGLANFGHCHFQFIRNISTTIFAKIAIFIRVVLKISVKIDSIK